MSPPLPVYLDNHATTRVDPRVVEAMLPFFDRVYGNAASLNHPFGDEARAAVEDSRTRIAVAINAEPDEIVFTSGATESNNLAIKGIGEHPRRRGAHFLSVSTEHPSVLDPLARLGERGCEVTLLPVADFSRPEAGTVDVQALVEQIRPETALVSVMLANNEIGVIQPIAEIGRVCRAQNVPLHCDATQAVGKMHVDVRELVVDLMSFSAHKIYGPKGVGALYVRRRGSRMRLRPLLDGGGHEHGLRSGTLNTPGIVGFAKALELCLAEGEAEWRRLRNLRDGLWRGLIAEIEGARLNGPSLDIPGSRLSANLNATFPGVEGESLMLTIRDLAVSSGSACTTASPEPSHVLRALGMDDDAVRASLRFGLGRFTTDEEIDFAIRSVCAAVKKLRKSGGAA